MLRWLLLGLGLVACGSPPAAVPPPPRPRPCLTVSGGELRAADAKKLLDDLVAQIQLAPEEEALRSPKSLADIRAILRRDAVYLFGPAAAYARSLGTLDSRFEEATLEILLGESELIAAQVLATQEAWLGSELRIARANLATEGSRPTTDRGRMLADLIRMVEEGNRIGAALAAVAPTHLARASELVRELRKEAATDPRTAVLVAEYHRARGEWPEFEAAMTAAESTERGSPRLCYLRAIEPLERQRQADVSAARLRECRKLYPRYVRAQAGLVLTAGSADQAFAEIEQLRAVNQDHWLVMLLEPTLEADRMLSHVRDPGAK